MEQGRARDAGQRIGPRLAERAFGARGWERKNVRCAPKTFGGRFGDALRVAKRDEIRDEFYSVLHGSLFFHNRANIIYAMGIFSF
jgi:hypothetical protein